MPGQRGRSWRRGDCRRGACNTGNESIQCSQIGGQEREVLQSVAVPGEPVVDTSLLLPTASPDLLLKRVAIPCSEHGCVFRRPLRKPTNVFSQSRLILFRWHRVQRDLAVAAATGRVTTNDMRSEPKRRRTHPLQRDVVIEGSLAPPSIEEAPIPLSTSDDDAGARSQITSNQGT